MPVKPFETAPTPLKDCESPRSDVSMRVSIKVEDILRTRCELRFDMQQKFKFLNWERVL